MGLTGEEETNIHIAMYVSLSLSLLGSFFILAMYAVFSELRAFAFKLVVYLTIADVLKSICKVQAAYLLPTSGVSCYISATGISFGSLSSVLWTATIAWSLYITVVRGREDIQSLERYFHLCCWGVPAGMAVLPFATNSYGPAQGWCWVAASKDSLWIGTMWRLLVFYIPLWMVIPLNIYFYARIIKAIRVHSSSGLIEVIEIRDTLIRRLRFYPFVLLICYVSVTIKRIYDFIDPEEGNMTLSLVAASTMCLNGLLNALVYGLTGSVKDAIRQRFESRSRSGSLLSDDAISLPRRSHMNVRGLN